MQHIIPPLTTVRFPRYEIGARRAETVVARVMGQALESGTVDLGF